MPTLQLIGEVGTSVSGLFADFRIKRVIGRGGMGVVYEAEQISLSRTVALKILPMAAILPERQIQRFKHEARAAAALQHSHIVPIYAVGFENGVHYFSMQYIEGTTLAHDSHSNDQPQLSAANKDHWKRVAEIGIQIAEALDYAHDLGVIHRDVKPANLLVDTFGKVWLADFGLAHLETEPALTMTGAIIGTLRYMSPEQASGESGVVDHRTDIYSFGITLYELVTRKTAFEHPDRLQLLKKVLECQPLLPRKINSEIPIDLETILLKAIAKDSRDRYPSARAFSDDLRRFLQHRPSLAMRPTLSERFVRWSKRHVKVLIAATAYSFFLTVGLAIASGLVWQAQGRTQAVHGRAINALQFANLQREEADLQSQNAKRLAFKLAFDRGLSLCEQGDLAPGVLWLARALELVPDDQPRLQSIVRLNLREWSQRLAPLASFHRLAKGSFVNAIAMDTKSHQIAIGTGQVVEVWDVARKPSASIPIEFHSNVTALAFSPEGQSLLVGTADGKTLFTAIHRTEFATDLVQVRDAVTGHVLQEIDAEHTIQFMTLSRNGKQLVTAGKNEIRIWSVEKTILLSKKTVIPDAIYSLEISPDASFVAVGVKNQVQLLNTDSLLPSAAPLTHYGDVHCLKVSADGWTLFSASESSSHCWDLKTGQRLCTLAPFEFPVTDAVISDDRQSIVIADMRGRVFRHELLSGKRTMELLRKTFQSRAVAFHPGGETAMTVGGDGKAKIFYLETGHPIGSSRQHYGTVSTIAFAQDAGLVATLVPSGLPIEPARDIQVGNLSEEIAGAPEEISRWVQVTTGMELDQEEVPTLLTPEVWQKRKLEMTIEQTLEHLVNP